jgi:hypothetical protein
MVIDLRAGSGAGESALNAGAQTSNIPIHRNHPRSRYRINHLDNTQYSCNLQIRFHTPSVAVQASPLRQATIARNAGPLATMPYSYPEPKPLRKKTSPNGAPAIGTQEPELGLEVPQLHRSVPDIESERSGRNIANNAKTGQTCSVPTLDLAARLDRMKSLFCRSFQKANSTRFRDK